ncbi:hypothetical protein BgiMline_035262 [Biomphalaria glabrata]
MNDGLGQATKAPHIYMLLARLQEIMRARLAGVELSPGGPSYYHFRSGLTRQLIIDIAGHPRNVGRVTFILPVLWSSTDNEKLIVNIVSDFPDFHRTASS